MSQSSSSNSKFSSTSGGDGISGGNARPSAEEQKMIKDAQVIGQIIEKYPGLGM